MILFVGLDGKQKVLYAELEPMIEWFYMSPAICIELPMTTVREHAEGTLDSLEFSLLDYHNVANALHILGEATVIYAPLSDAYYVWVIADSNKVGPAASKFPTNAIF